MPGRGPKVIPKLKRGLLKKFGYSTKLPTKQRRIALRKADKVYGSANLLQKLQAPSVLFKRTRPDIARIFIADRNWVERVLLSKREALAMTAKPRRKWMRMSPAARARAMPSRKKLRRVM